MKRILLLALSLILLALPVLASAAAQTDTMEEFCRTHALELAEEMETVAATDALIEMYTTQPEVNEQAKSFAAAGLSQPTDYHFYQFDRSALLNSIAQQGGAELPALSEEECELLLKRLSGSVLFSLLQAPLGSTMLAACSVTNTMRSYVAPEGWTGDALLILTREDAEWAIGVSFTQSGPGALTANAAYLPAKMNGLPITGILGILEVLL